MGVKNILTFDSSSSLNSDEKLRDPISEMWRKWRQQLSCHILTEEQAAEIVYDYGNTPDSYQDCNG